MHTNTERVVAVGMVKGTEASDACSRRTLLVLGVDAEPDDARRAAGKIVSRRYAVRRPA